MLATWGEVRANVVRESDTVIAATVPDAALMRWVQSVPAIHCVAPAFRAWTGAHDAPVVPVTATSGERFARAGFSGGVIAGLTKVAGGGTAQTFWLGRVPAARVLVLHAGSEAQEDSFSAVVSDAPWPPPRPVALLRAAPRTAAFELGSKRSDVERVLGAGKAKALCGFEVVRYELRPAEASISEMWLFYRDGRVAAIARYEAV